MRRMVRSSSSSPVTSSASGGVMPKVTNKQQTEILEKWVQYYNMWIGYQCLQDGWTFRPTGIDQWTVWDPEHDLFGIVHSKRRIAHGDGSSELDFLIILEVSDGDEGGPSTLIAGYQGAWFGTYESRLSWIVQLFDTMPSYIWSSEEGFKTPPHGYMIAEHSYVNPQEGPME